MSARLVTVEQTRTEMTQLVLPTHANNHGNIFGGQLMAWMDICAAVSGMRFVVGQVVTASMDELHFLRPIRRGHVAVLRSQVNRAWRTSMEVGVRVDAEDPMTGERFHGVSGYLTFVAVDADGKPTPTPALDWHGSEESRRRWGQAGGRRDRRLAARQQTASRTEP